VTAFLPIPGPEKPEKVEKPPAGEGGTTFSGFSTFSGPGETPNTAPVSQAAETLAAVRAYRRTPPPKPPRKSRQAARGRRSVQPVPPPSTSLAGVPPLWCEGVALLATLPAPDGITPPRWRAFQATAARLLRDRGTELHAAGWDTLDLFGLHAAAPEANPPGWGLAWLLGTAGEVLDVSPPVVGMTREAGGARLALYKRQVPARAGILPAWNLSRGSA